MRKLRSIGLLLLLLAASQSWAAGELPPSGEKLAEAILSAYDQLESYCDRGEDTYFSSRRVFERCYTATGHYKFEEQLVGHATNRTVRWGGPTKEYGWTGRHAGWWIKTLGYQERPAGTLSTGKLPNDFATRVVGRILRDSWRESLRANLAGFVLAPDYLDQDLILLRKVSLHRDAGKEVVQELWLRRKDRLVWRYQKTFDGRVTDETHLKSVRVNDPDSLDLDFKAPLTARYSFSSRPVQYFSGMTILVAFMGLCAGLIRSWFLRQSLAAQAAPVLWSRTTKTYLGAWGLIVAGALVHAAFFLLMILLRPEAAEGYGWGLAYLYAYSVWAVLILLMVGGFILGWHSARRIGWHVLRSRENRGV